jgi:predicted metal-binding membrane protein
VTALPAASRPRLRPSWPFAVIALAWVVATLLWLTGASHSLGHADLLEGQRPLLVVLLLFLVGWQLMLAAMMLPSSLPMIRHYASVVERQALPRRGAWEFVGGYVLIWTAFGVLALLADAGLHRVVETWSWLEDHEQFILAGALGLAGAVQFTGLKDRCLRQCRRPYAFLLHKRLQGVTGPVRLGVDHGLFCVGCCWALMLVMFAVGAAELTWMLGLSAVMVYEKTAPRGERLVPIVGVALLALAALVAIDPAWLPAALSSTH